MKEVIVDTSSILYGFSNNKSVFEAIALKGSWRPLVSKGIINELRIISKNKGSKGRIAKAALKEINLKKIKIANTSIYPDLWIKRMCSEKEGLAVVTNDTALAKELSDKAIILKFSIDGKLRAFR